MISVSTDHLPSILIDTFFENPVPHVLPSWIGNNRQNPEFIARIRALLDKNEIPWQTQTPKVDVGGGGTIGGFMSREDMEVIDIGVPLLSMHATVEGSSKVDLWNLYRFFKVFYQSQ